MLVSLADFSSLKKKVHDIKILLCNWYLKRNCVSVLADIITDEDIEIVLATLGTSWQELGQALGFSQRELEKFTLTSQSFSDAGEKMLREWQSVHSQNATFFALLGALEIVQRREIADQLVAARMTGGEGIAI